ncbi:MAG: cytochrome c family protein [Rhizobiales bacterium]|nr:cytochrome c family protein [Hyphomicrobiales bacterium]
MNQKFLAIAITALVASQGPAIAEGDAKKGKSVFKRCVACHSVDKEKNKVGPHLVGIMGRKAGVVEKFKYSKAMLAKGAEGLVWDETNIDAYLEKPRKFIPKNRMAFVGLKKAKDRANVIAYLKEATKKKE